MDWMNHEIRFMKNYNNKLLCQFFRTIRPVVTTYKIGLIYKIICPGLPFFKAKVVGIGPRMCLGDLTDEITLLDAGMKVTEFYALFCRFYEDNEWWKEWDTKIREIYIKRMEPFTITNVTKTRIIREV